ncbi:hypothetical protein VDGL01_08329 [Verticillium dahliae]
MDKTKRRKNYQGCCEYVAARRGTLLKNYSIYELVFVPHFMTIETLSTVLKYHNLREVIQREIPRSDYDFYSDWLKYCNAQSELVRRDLALVEGAHYLASGHVQPDDKESWTSSCGTVLSTLEHSAPFAMEHEDEADDAARRKRRKVVAGSSQRGKRMGNSARSTRTAPLHVQEDQGEPSTVAEMPQPVLVSSSQSNTHANAIGQYPNMPLWDHFAPSAWMNEITAEFWTME